MEEIGAKGMYAKARPVMGSGPRQTIEPGKSITTLTPESVARSLKTAFDYFDDREIQKQMERIISELFSYGIVSKEQLDRLVKDRSTIGYLESMYIKLLGRPEAAPLDPTAVATWGAPLFVSRMDYAVMKQIEEIIYQSQERRKAIESGRVKA